MVPRIAALAGPSSTVRVLRVLKTLNLPESRLDALMGPLLPRHPHITFGYRAHLPENHLKLMAEANSREEALERLAAAERDARAAPQDKCFGADDDTLSGVILASLRSRGERLALAESCTGGMVASLVTQVPGASDVLCGAAITYAERAKTLWAGVPEGRASGGASDWGLSVTDSGSPSGGGTEPATGNEPLTGGRVTRLIADDSSGGEDSSRRKSA